jgi:hypothetical protein
VLEKRNGSGLSVSAVAIEGHQRKCVSRILTVGTLIDKRNQACRLNLVEWLASLRRQECCDSLHVFGRRRGAEIGREMGTVGWRGGYGCSEDLCGLSGERCGAGVKLSWTLRI